MHDFAYDFDTVTPEAWRANEESWKEKLLKLPNWFKVPLINSNASHNLSDGTLARFRGMVQDMHNPEFYFEEFEVYNSVTNEVKTKSGKYTDTSSILENEKINYTENLKSAQRQTIVAVSLPGLNKWAQELEDEKNHLKHLEDQPNTSKRLNVTKFKRSYDDCEDEDAMDIESSDGKKEPRVTEAVKESANVVSREHLLNFPLPDVASKSCIIKIYDDSENLKLNDMIEVVGFLSVDPALSGEFQPEKNALLEPTMETEVETITHNPPPSLVPRLHAVYVKKLDHCNPLIKDGFIQATPAQIEVLLDFMHEHTYLARRLLRGAAGRIRSKRLWESLCNSLNSMGGCTKSVEQWQRVWSDIKHMAENAAGAAWRSAHATDGGPSEAPTLSQVELKIISIMGQGFGEPQTQCRVPAFPLGPPVREPVVKSPPHTATPADPISQEREEALEAAPVPQCTLSRDVSKLRIIRNQRTNLRRVRPRVRRRLTGDIARGRIVEVEEQRLELETRKNEILGGIRDALVQLCTLVREHVTRDT